MEDFIKWIRINKPDHIIYAVQVRYAKAYFDGTLHKEKFAWPRVKLKPAMDNLIKEYEDQK